MPYRYSERFETNQGYRFRRNNRSLRLQALAPGRRMTEDQLFGFARRLGDHLAQVGGISTLPVADVRRALTFDDYENASPATALYKYVGDDTLAFIKKGSFQLGTAKYYREAPNLKIRDPREGWAFMALANENNQVTVPVVSGFNAAIFCGTAEAAGDDAHMRDTFGRNLLKIGPIPDFLAALKRKTRAFRVSLFDVVYADVHTFTSEIADAAVMRRFLASTPSLHMLNRMYFDLFYRVSLLPSLYTKPASYAHERERRVVLEMRDDLRQDRLFLNDKSLLDFVKIVEATRLGKICPPDAVAPVDPPAGRPEG